MIDQITLIAQSFTSEEACVSYAAMGGVLSAKTQSQRDCESFGGTFFISGSPSLALWLCRWTNTGDDYSAQTDVLISDCKTEANNVYRYDYNFGHDPVVPGTNTGVCRPF
jgi:hypothetical protein